MVCDRCGESIEFPPECRGTVQECPRCDAYLDVGDPDAPPELEENNP